MPETKESKFNLGDYVEVKERIRILYELYANARLVTDQVDILTDPAGKQRVMVRALAYRSPDDPHPGVGYSWMELPGTTSYTRGSELENTETSAWGRAIASLGILIDRSIASGQEVQSKSDPDPERTVDQATGEILPMEFTGRIKYGPSAPTDGGLRFGPDDESVFGFRLDAMDGKKGIPQVIAKGAIAVALHDEREAKRLNDGDTVTVWGDLERIRWKKEGRDMPPFQRLTIARVQTGELVIPAPAALTPDDEVELDLALDSVR